MYNLLSLEVKNPITYQVKYSFIILMTMTMTKFIIKISTSFKVYKRYIDVYRDLIQYSTPLEYELTNKQYKINDNFCKNKQYNEEHQYHKFFHATLCIVNMNMTSLDTCFFIIKNNNNTNIIYIK